jgi:hypothetical protein
MNIILHLLLLRIWRSVRSPPHAKTQHFFPLYFQVAPQPESYLFDFSWLTSNLTHFYWNFGNLEGSEFQKFQFFHSSFQKQEKNGEFLHKGRVLLCEPSGFSTSLSLPASGISNPKGLYCRTYSYTQGGKKPPSYTLWSVCLGSW